MKNTQTGFSLIELLVTMAIMSTIAVLGFGAYKIAQQRNQTALVMNAITSDLRRAQLQSRAVEGDSQWGVKIQNNSVIVFKGATYASRTTSADEVYALPKSFTYSGLDEIVFSKLYGYPTSAGTITITSPNNTVSTITINAKGTVSY